MSKELTIFREGRKSFLAVGFIEDRGTSNDLLAQYRAVDVNDDCFYTNNYDEALAFISNGLVQPTKTWTMP